MLIPKFLPLAKISEQIGIPVGSLKAKLHAAKKGEIPMPPRRRIGHAFFYDTESFVAWLWEHAAELQQTVSFQKD
jgi:hypothetical protein